MRLRSLLVSGALLAPAVQAASSDVANRNLGVNPEQVKRVQQAMQNKPADALLVLPTGREIKMTGNHPRVEKLEVFADFDDFDGPYRSPLRAFSDRLEKDRPLTPAERTQLVLSFFLGGPMPEKEPSIEERTRSRVERGGTMLANPRGTLQ